MKDNYIKKNQANERRIITKSVNKYKTWLPTAHLQELNLNLLDQNWVCVMIYQIFEEHKQTTSKLLYVKLIIGFLPVSKNED